MHPAVVSRIELFDQPDVVAGNLSNCCGKTIQILDAEEVQPGVEARRAYQKRK